MSDLQAQTLDVREELDRGGEPLPTILEAVSSLAPGQPLRLLTTFEPLPLYTVLARKGFSHEAVRHGEGDWEVVFTPGELSTYEEPVGSPALPGAEGDWPEATTFLDNRGLAPPEPLVRILSALERLQPGQVLEAVNARDPVFLYPELHKRGAAIQTRPEADGVRLFIRRGGQS